MAKENTSVESRVRLIKLALRISGVNMSEKTIHHILALHEVISKDGGNANLRSITQIELLIKDNYK